LAEANRLPYDKSRFLIGVEPARRQWANHAEAGTMLQREVNALGPLPSMIVSVLLLGSTRRDDTTLGRTRQPASFSGGKIPAGVGGVAAELLPPGFSSVSYWQSWRIM
jgi:hypothetical protein